LKNFHVRSVVVVCTALLSAIPAPVLAQGRPAASWLNIQGDASDAAVDTIEVNPETVAVNGPLRTMRVRVSRSVERKNWDGLLYRSYIAEVLFNCNDNNARYVAMEYFMQPNWKGEPYATTRYEPTETRSMRFRDITPNPAAQIIRAACHTAGITSN
jgi:hypothetical protein